VCAAAGAGGPEQRTVQVWEGLRLRCRFGEDDRPDQSTELTQVKTRLKGKAVQTTDAYSLH
jgi:hypothetical protein